MIRLVDVFSGPLRGQKNQLLVFLCVLSKTDDDGVVRWLSDDSIASETGLVLDEVREAISSTPVLERFGVWGVRIVEVGKIDLATYLSSEEGKRFLNKPETKVDADAVIPEKISGAEKEEKKERKKPNFDLTTHEHARLIELWCQAFRMQFGKDYVVSGGKDGKAVKMILAAKLTPEDAISTAKRAWVSGKFWGSKATTLTMFAARLNEIQSELAAPVVVSGSVAPSSDDEYSGGEVDLEGSFQ